MQAFLELADAHLGHLELLAALDEEELQLAYALLQILTDGAAAGFALRDFVHRRQLALEKTRLPQRHLRPCAAIDQSGLGIDFAEAQEFLHSLLRGRTIVGFLGQLDEVVHVQLLQHGRLDPVDPVVAHHVQGRNLRRPRPLLQFGKIDRTEDLAILVLLQEPLGGMLHGGILAAPGPGREQIRRGKCLPRAGSCPMMTDLFDSMKAGLHPDYAETTITCTCGAVYHTRSTRRNIKIGICAACHPFFTGEQKFIDTAGRVEKFSRRYGSVKAARVKKA